ncbi:MAG: hypothetical protein AAB465_00040 [Patescibacteria group bacterium]
MKQGIVIDVIGVISAGVSIGIILGMYKLGFINSVSAMLLAFVASGILRLVFNAIKDARNPKNRR